MDGPVEDRTKELPDVSKTERPPRKQRIRRRKQQRPAADDADADADRKQKASVKRNAKQKKEPEEEEHDEEEEEEEKETGKEQEDDDGRGDEGDEEEEAEPDQKKKDRSASSKSNGTDDADDGGPGEEEEEEEAPRPAAKKKDSASKASKKADGESKQKKAKKESKKEAKKESKKKKKDQQDRKSGKRTAAAMAGLVTRDPVTGGPVEFSITQIPGRIGLLRGLFGLESSAVEKEASELKTRGTDGHDLAAALTNNSPFEFASLPYRETPIWPTQTLNIAFDMQHVRRWTDTTAYSSAKQWDANTPIRLPAVLEAIDIPLRERYFADHPALAARTGILSGQPTRNLVVIHQVVCRAAVCENMHTDFGAVFAALKPLTLASRYPDGKCYGRDLQLDTRMIEKVFKSYCGQPPDAKKKQAQDATTKASDAMIGAMSSSQEQERAVRNTRQLADTLTFSSLSDKFAAWMQKKATSSSSSKKSAPDPTATDAHWDTRLPKLDLSLYINRYFAEDVFDSPYASAMQLPHASKSARDHWRAHPTIPVMTKPGGGRVVYTRVPVVGMRLPERHADHACKDMVMYVSDVMNRVLELEKTKQEQSKEIRAQFAAFASVDINAEMVTAVKHFLDAKDGVEAYIADCRASSSSSTDPSPVFDSTVRGRIEDYSRYRVVFDTRKRFHRFRCWLDQYAYRAWRKLLQMEAEAILKTTAKADSVPTTDSPEAATRPGTGASAGKASPAPAPDASVAAAAAAAAAAVDTGDATPSSSSKTINGDAAADAAPSSPPPPSIAAVDMRSLEAQLLARNFVQEGPFLVISVSRAMLVNLASLVCASSQTELVDLNTAHLTLIPAEPMEVIARSLSESEKSARPRVSIQVTVTFTHVSC